MNGVEGLFCAFSLHTLKQCFLEEHGYGSFILCMTVWHLWCQVCDPFPSQMRCPAHMDQAWEDLSWDTSLQAWSPAPGQNWSGQGIKRKAAHSAEHWQPRCQGREGRVTGWFSLLVWEPAVIFFYHPIQPNLAKLLCQHQLTDLL